LTIGEGVRSSGFFTATAKAEINKGNLFKVHIHDPVIFVV
jgi:hypothetical protein